MQRQRRCTLLNDAGVKVGFKRAVATASDLVEGDQGLKAAGGIRRMFAFEYGDRDETRRWFAIVRKAGVLKNEKIIHRTTSSFGGVRIDKTK